MIFLYRVVFTTGPLSLFAAHGRVWLYKTKGLIFCDQPFLEPTVDKGFVSYIKICKQKRTNKQ